MFNTHIQCLRELLHPMHRIFSNKAEKTIITRISSTLLEFRKNLANLTKTPVFVIMDDLSKVLGYGEGSTPLSDDVFLGMVATIYSLETNVEKEFNILSKMPYERYTTSRSSQLCRDFFNLNFPYEIRSYLNLIKANLSIPSNKSLFIREINKIYKIGASSGKSFLLGSLWELNFRDFEGSFNS